MEWYLKVVRDNYANFSGRARRKEYWMFFLINIIISVALSLVDTMIGTTFGEGNGIISTIYSLAVLVPSLAVLVRRLHDTDRSGWWFLIALIPLVGAIILIVFLATDGKPGMNKWGQNPKEVEGDPSDLTLDEAI